LTSAPAPRSAEDGFEFSIATATATAGHRRLAFAIIGLTIVAYLLIAANAAAPLPHVHSFIPTVYAIVFVADIVTAVLLFAQFSATHSRSLLVLASGYLFASLMVVAHSLTFPEAFTPTGLLGAGAQTSPWLYVLWRLGFGVAIVSYAMLRSNPQTRNVVESSPRSALSWAVALVIFAALALITLTTAGRDLLPPVIENIRFLPLGLFATGLIALTNLLALVLLAAAPRKTILDLWLIVAVFALLAESTMVTFFIPERYTFGFYALRAISVPVAKVVLVVLLWESMRLHANLAISNRELRHERANRLTNAAMGLAAIAHEIRQPLTGIGLTAAAGQQMLDRSPPDIDKAKAFLGEIREGATNANEVFVGILKLFRGEKDRGIVDVNALTVEATRRLRQALEDNDVALSTTLASDLPVVRGDSAQLQEVILNLIQASIETMTPATTSRRVINIETSRLGPGAVSISLQDSGPGIEPQKLANIFDPFVTTKGGPGLGLAICKMIVEHHGGKLSAVSHENGGARFDITLPVTAD
jgi:signal transduction histidine kinase